MSSRAALGAFLCLLLMHPAPSVDAQDWQTFAAASMSAQDSVLISAIDGADFQTALDIYRGVSRRVDPSLGSFFRILADSRADGAWWQKELLLRILLEPFSDSQASGDFRRARLAVNADALAALFTRMTEWNDPLLAATLVRIAALTGSPEALQAVVKVGARLIDALRKGNGYLFAPEATLAQDYLASASAFRRQLLAEQCAEIARLSRDAVLVKEARDAAEKLLSSSTP
jgi:hypothetical protein